MNSVSSYSVRSVERKGPVGLVLASRQELQNADCLHTAGLAAVSTAPTEVLHDVGVVAGGLLNE
jgi:hypothetical protein